MQILFHVNPWEITFNRVIFMYVKYDIVEMKQYTLHCTQLGV